MTTTLTVNDILNAIYRLPGHMPVVVHVKLDASDADENGGFSSIVAIESVHQALNQVEINAGS